MTKGKWHTALVHLESTVQFVRTLLRTYIPRMSSSAGIERPWRNAKIEELPGFTDSIDRSRHVPYPQRLGRFAWAVGRTWDFKGITNVTKTMIFRVFMQRNALVYFKTAQIGNKAHCMKLREQPQMFKDLSGPYLTEPKTLKAIIVEGPALTPSGSQCTFL